MLLFYIQFASILILAAVKCPQVRRFVNSIPSDSQRDDPVFILTEPFLIIDLKMQFHRADRLDISEQIWRHA